jgi:hypothetical protein
VVRGSYRVRRCRRGRRGTTTDDKLRRELITAWQAIQPGDLYRAFTIQGPTGAKPSQACRSGDLVAVLGLGGLGHLGVQLANTLGSETVDGLRHNGELMVIGADPEPIQVSPFQIIATSKTVHRPGPLQQPSGRSPTRSSCTAGGTRCGSTP